MFLRARECCPHAPIPLRVSKLLKHSCLQGQDGRGDLGQGGTAMFAASQSALSLNSIRFPMSRAGSCSPSHDSVLSLPAASRHHYQLCKMGCYIDSFAVTSKCDVLAVDRGGRRRRRQGEKSLWELSQHIRNTLPAAQTHS